MPGIPKISRNLKRGSFPPFPPESIGRKPDATTSALDRDTITHVLKLPPSATDPPNPSIRPQIVSRQLGLITSALKTGKPVSELEGPLQLAGSRLSASDTQNPDELAASSKSFLSGLLNPAIVVASVENPTAVPEKLAALTNVLKTGNPVDDTIKLLGAGALPVPAPESISTAFSTVAGALSANNLIPDQTTDVPPVLDPNSTSGALATIASALKSKDLLSDPAPGKKEDLQILPPLPISDAVSNGGSLSNTNPQTVSDALGTVSDALKSAGLIPPGDKDPLEILPVSVPGSVKDALETVVTSLHANDLVADATELPATILPASSAQVVSDALGTITTALKSEASSADIKQLGIASGLPNPITEAIVGAIEKIESLPIETAQTVSTSLGNISDTLTSSDHLLDATGPPGSAAVAPITSSVAQTLDDIVTLAPDAAKPISEILDAITDAVRSDSTASPLLPSDSLDAGPGPASTLGFEVPDADNATNSNPQPDGHRGKRIIICCDGTWQDSDNGDAGFPTNVTRFARSLKSVSDDGITQIVYYQSGVGSSYASKFGRLIAGGTGLGLSEHVREAFVFISNNYHVGDELFIIGFSRGAFTARSIAGLIDRIGVLTRRGMESFPKIYEDYVNFRLKDQSYINKQGWERIKGVTIRALGCWDTVGALGIPTSPIIEKCKCNEKYKFHDTDLSPTTQNAFHALALDERRLPFTPTLWRLPVRSPKERHRDIIPNLKQVWFPGGGGYADQELSDLTLVWMIEQLSPFLGFDLDYVKSLNKGPDGNNWASGKIFNSFRGIMKGAGSKVRTPGGYFPNPPRSVVKRAFTFGAGVFGRPGVESVTNEEIHPSVRGRMIASNGEWCSRALFGWKCDKRVVQSAAGPVERWVWKNPDTGTELFESDLGAQERVLAGTDVLNKLESMTTVPFRKNKSLNMDKGSVESKWDEQPE
ncbi:hypothetical protein TWF696_004874 [Orbilia brochopaga]|uniref:T6SS Phospholipase effector Tle1-like catalytic domain-containing protein n=1 Tax=Orbilia brochopaga TaxID=3140254 RepID=A0AAV9V301_9PEZI